MKTLCEHAEEFARLYFASPIVVLDRPIAMWCEKCHKFTPEDEWDAFAVALAQEE